MTNGRIERDRSEKTAIFKKKMNVLPNGHFDVRDNRMKKLSDLLEQFPIIYYFLIVAIALTVAAMLITFVG